MLGQGHLREPLARAAARGRDWRSRVGACIEFHRGSKSAAVRHLGIARSTLDEAIALGVSGSLEPDTDRTLPRTADAAPE